MRPSEHVIPRWRVPPIYASNNASTFTPSPVAGQIAASRKATYIFAPVVALICLSSPFVCPLNFLPKVCHRLFCLRIRLRTLAAYAPKSINSPLAPFLDTPVFVGFGELPSDFIMFSSNRSRYQEGSFSKHRASKSKSHKKNPSFRDSPRKVERLAQQAQVSSPQSNQTSPTIGR